MNYGKRVTFASLLHAPCFLLLNYEKVPYTKSMTRKPLIIGNWKMELSDKAALEVARSIHKLISDIELSAEVVACPSYPALPQVAALFQKKSLISVGAQNVALEERGAFTGQVSIAQIRPYVSWCIVGHSEVRAHLGDSEEDVAHKTQLLLKHGLMPVVCIGETAAERDGDQTVEKITSQIDTLLSYIDRAALAKVVIAYEPIWAIGTGVTPEPDAVAEIVLLIRKITAGRFDKAIAERMRILYGGSVKPDNVAGYVSGPAADGALVGGASVHPKDFIDIIRNVQEKYILSL